MEPTETISALRRILDARELAIRQMRRENAQLLQIAKERELALIESTAEADRMRAIAHRLTADLKAKDVFIENLARACDERLEQIKQLSVDKTREP